MKTLYLDPCKTNLYFALVCTGKEPFFSGTVADYRTNSEEYNVFEKISTEISGQADSDDMDSGVDAVAIRVPAGIAGYGQVVSASDSVFAEMEKAAWNAPVHMTVAINLAKSVKLFYHDVPVVFLFESAFFEKLPEREKHYAIDPDMALKRMIIRRGYHGLLHSAVCRAENEHALCKGVNRKRILSICLEPRPEAAAIYGLRPVMVTSGATPLEGLMGDTSCGDIDAGIIVTVAKEFNWGVEKINRMLSEESGLTGMAGHRVTIKDLFDSGFESGNPAREMFLYRLLQVCGSGIAAMGAIDSIVFSGRYRMAGKLIGPWLVKKLSFLKNTVPSVDLQWSIFPQTIEMLAGSYVGAVVAKVMV